MKKNILIFLCVCLLISCAQKSGSGNISNQTKTVGEFTGVKVAGGFEVEIKTGLTQNVVVEADDNLIKYINVNVVAGELKISLDEIGVRNAHLKVFITAPRISSVKTSAGAEVVVKDELKSDKTINLSASSGSNIKAALDAPEVKVEVSSSGELELSGKTKDFHAKSSSGSSVAATGLLSENSFVDVSSGGNVHVYASVSLDANASSGGNVYYRGGAASVKKSASSGGEIEMEK